MGCKPSKPSSSSNATPNKYCKKPPHYTRMGCNQHLSHESSCQSVCTNGNDCSRCTHMRESRREHVEAVLRRGDTVRIVGVPGDVDQRGNRETEVGPGDVKQSALEEGTESIGLEVDIADSHNVWI